MVRQASWSHNLRPLVMANSKAEESVLSVDAQDLDDLCVCSSTLTWHLIRDVLGIICYAIAKWQSPAFLVASISRQFSIFVCIEPALS